LHSVDEDFDRSQLIPETHEDKIIELEQVYGVKASKQKKFNDQALLELAVK
jgi:hypothetical protein